MWTVSDLYKSKIQEQEREWKICVRIRYKNNTQVEFWDDDIIGDPAINSQCVSGGTNEEMIDIGAVCAKTLELTIIDTQSDLHRYAGARADINVYLKTGSKDKPETDHDPAGYEKIPMGSFWADTTKLSRVGQNITFTAYDGVITLQYLITDDMRAAMKGQTATACAMLLAAYSAMGFNQDLSAMPNGDIPLDFDSPQIVTAWDGVMWIAQLMGCFARAGRKNFLEFVPIKSDWEYFNDEHTIGTIISARDIKGSERYATTFSDDRMHIIGVAMEGDDKKIVTCGGGGLEDDANVTILMEKNPIFASSGKSTYDVLSAILDQIGTAYFYSFQTEMRNDPALDAGDVIRLQGGVINGTNKNNDLIGFITHSTWKYHGRQTITNVGQVPIVYRDTPTAAVAALSNDEDGNAPMAETRSADDLFQVAPVPQSQKVRKDDSSGILKRLDDLQAQIDKLKYGNMVILRGYTNFTISSVGIKSINVGSTSSARYAQALAAETGWQLQADGITVLKDGEIGFSFDHSHVWLSNNIKKQPTDGNFRYNYGTYMDICTSADGTATAFGFRSSEEPVNLTFLLAKCGTGEYASIGIFQSYSVYEFKKDLTDIKTFAAKFETVGSGKPTSITKMPDVLNDGETDEVFYILSAPQYPEPGKQFNIGGRYVVVSNNYYVNPACLAIPL